MNKRDLCIEYARDWRSLEETLRVFFPGTGKALVVLLSQTVSPSHPTSIGQFLKQFQAVHEDTFVWLLEHSQPVPNGEALPVIPLSTLISTTAYLKNS